MHDTRRGGDACGEHDVELPTARDVEQQASSWTETGDGPAEEGLGRIDDTTAAEGDDGLLARAYVVGVVHEQWRAERRRQLEQRAAADAQCTVRSDLRRVRQQPELDGAMTLRI